MEPQWKSNQCQHRRQLTCYNWFTFIIKEKNYYLSLQIICILFCWSCSSKRMYKFTAIKNSLWSHLQKKCHHARKSWLITEITEICHRSSIFMVCYPVKMPSLMLTNDLHVKTKINVKLAMKGTTYWKNIQ